MALQDQVPEAHLLQLILEILQQASIAFFTPHTYIFKRTCHYCIPLKKTSIRMATLMPKHVEGTSQSDNFLLLTVQLLN
jgi:hypothetical protein